MRNIYLSVFALFIFSGLLFSNCNSSVNDGGKEVEDLSCIVEGANAVDGYISAWERCTRNAAEDLHRITLRSLDGDVQVQVSDTLYSAYSPLIWENAGHLMVMYAENRDMDSQQIVHHAHRIEMKTYTLGGELVSGETLMEARPGTFGTFQMPFGKVERTPNSTLVYWSDNEVESVSRTAHLFEIENGKVTASQYLTGTRAMSTPHAIQDTDRYIFTFMASLSPHEIEEDGVETDRNSIFLVETDAQFQPLSEEIVINMGGDSDWGVRPAVSKLGDNYAVVFLSNNSPSASLARLNIRIYDPETKSVIHSETDDHYTYLTHQIVSDAEGNLLVFYTEADMGYSAGAYNLRVKTMEQGSLQTNDQFVMSLTNPNFFIEKLEGNLVRLYHGGTSSGEPVSARQLNLASLGN